MHGISSQFWLPTFIKKKEQDNGGKICNYAALSWHGLRVYFVMAARRIQLGSGLDQSCTGSLQNKAVGELRCLSRFTSVAEPSGRKVAIGCDLSRYKVSDDHWLIYMIANMHAALI